MGFFSWLCAKSNKPVLHSSGDWYGREFSKVVVVTPKSVAYGEYDGYGTVSTDMGDLEVLEAVESGEAKLVLERFYNGEKFAQLPVCKSDPGQGHFYSMDDLAKIFGPLPADEQRQAAIKRVLALDVRRKKAQEPAAKNISTWTKIRHFLLGFAAGNL